MSNFSCGENKTVKEKDPCQKNACISDSCWLERPRFFNGQMLTDTDLKSGQDYVIEKNKLHNRYLHGWGVVCGLKVKCYPCCDGYGSSGKVVVEPGYAIDCCGNDLAVGEAQEYDVIKRINQMKKKQEKASSPCGTATTTETTTCTESEEKYYLVISYKEEEGKPTSALNAGDPCSIQRCEPTRTKECFQLDLVKFCTLEPTVEENLFTTVQKCYKIFFDTWKRVLVEELELKTLAAITPDHAKTFLKEYYKALSSNVHCDILDRLEEIGSTQTKTTELKDEQAILLYRVLTTTNDDGTNPNAVTMLNNEPYRLNLSNDAVFTRDDEWNWTVTDGAQTYRILFDRNQNGAITGATITTNAASLQQLYVILVQLFMDSVCQAFLVPCPTCGKDDVVILATITVKNDKIEKICNLARKYVLTAHSFKYWYSWIPDMIASAIFKNSLENFKFKVNSVGDALEFLCCIFDISEAHSQPPYVHVLKFMEKNFAIPKMMGENLQETLGAMAQQFMKPLDPQNVSFKEAVNKDVAASKEILKKLNIKVVGTETYDPIAKRFSMEDIVSSMPVAPRGSEVIQVVDENNKVKGFRVVKTAPGKEKEPEPTQAADELTALKTQLLDMNKKMEAMAKELTLLKTKSPAVEQKQKQKQKAAAGESPKKK